VKKNVTNSDKGSLDKHSVF